MLNCHLALNLGNESVRIQKSEQGVQENDRCRVKEEVSALHWDDLDLLRGVAKSTSLRQAAFQLGLSINTVRTRISRLEEALGTIVLDRRKDGLFLTKNGHDALDIAVEMQNLRRRLDTGSGNNVVVKNGEISISCTEGVGEFWLSGFLPFLKNKLPGHVISINNDFDQDRIHSSKFDVSIGFSRPTDQDVMVKKISMLHFVVFASKEYIKNHGNPSSFDDLKGHSFVLQVAPGLNFNAIDIFVGAVEAKKFVTMKVNTSFSLFRAIVNGEAMGVLPTYATVINKDIVALDLPVQLRFELWLSFSRSSRNSIPIRKTIDWIEGCFDPEKFPWFSDKFVHPSQFEYDHSYSAFENDKKNSLMYLNQSI